MNRDETRVESGKQVQGGGDRKLVITGWIAMLVFAFSAFRSLTDMGDTWIAMASGRHIARHGISSGDPFSFNSLAPGPTKDEITTWPNGIRRIAEKVGIDTVQHWHPTGWINQNWLSHLLFYQLATYCGTEEVPNYTPLLLLKFAFYVITVLGVYQTARLLGAHPAVASWCASFSMLVGMGFTGLRPNEFTNMLAPVFVMILVLATYHNVLYAWVIVPLGILWSNLHGGYIYILIMLMPYIFLHGLIVLPRRWTMWCYSTVAWLALYVLILSNGYQDTLLPEAAAGPHTLALIVGVLMVLGLFMSWTAKLRTAYGYHVTASILLFLMAFAKTLLQVNVLSVVLVVLFVLFIGLGAIVTFHKPVLVSLKPVSICHLIGVFVVTAALTVAVSPFHLTNVTHIGVIGGGEHAHLWRGIFEWRPVWDWNCPYGNVVPFLAMMAIACCAFCARDVAQGVSARRQNRTACPDSGPHSPAYRLDIAMSSVIVLTVCMAMCSRRFIAIAAFVSCPLLAMWINQIITLLSQDMAGKHLNCRGRGMPSRTLLCDLTLWATIFVISLSLLNGYCFVKGLIVPWPYDFQDYSVFERIVSIYRQPQGACEFLKQNHVKGRMLNDWPEGGFIMWSMSPKTKTGEIEPKLFIDGRAQTAYSAEAFRDWIDIWRCRQIIQDLGCEPNAITDDEFRRIGEYVAKQLKERDVDVALVYNGYTRNNIVSKALSTCTSWQCVYLDDTHKVLVDAGSSEGQRLISGIENSRTVYPDAYTRHLSFAHFRRNQGAASDLESQGLGYAIRAFQIKPSLMAAKMVAGWKTESEELILKKKAICQDYVDQFEAHKTEFKHQAGFWQRRAAAERMAAFLKSLEDPPSDTVQTKKATSSGDERQINGILALHGIHGSQHRLGVTEVGSHRLVRDWSKSQLSVDSCCR